jgi:hypothetical protein
LELVYYIPNYKHEATFIYLFYLHLYLIKREGEKERRREGEKERRREGF